jgi:hypothetical protein
MVVNYFAHEYHAARFRVNTDPCEMHEIEAIGACRRYSKTTLRTRLARNGMLLH